MTECIYFTNIIIISVEKQTVIYVFFEDQYSFCWFNEQTRYFLDKCWNINLTVHYVVLKSVCWRIIIIIGLIITILCCLCVQKACCVSKKCIFFYRKLVYILNHVFCSRHPSYLTKMCVLSSLWLCFCTAKYLLLFFDTLSNPFRTVVLKGY